MKRIIGGLLVISLLSHPSATSYASQLAFEVVSKEQKIYFIMTKDSLIQQKIDYMFTSLLSNKKEIDNLLKTHNIISKKIQAILNQKISTKTAMSDEQIKCFKTYSSYSENKNEELKRVLTIIDSDKNLNSIQQEILHIDADYNKILNSLTKINNSQISAIELLRGLIDAGNNALNVL